jgi:hypothetical protein
MRADRPNFGPGSSASHAIHIRINNLARSPLVSDRTAESQLVGMKDTDMCTSLAVADWIKRIADDERRREMVRFQEDETAARKADLVRRNGRRLIDELRETVTRDVEAFRDEFPGDRARDIVVDARAPGGGFAVDKPSPAAVSLTVAPYLEAAAMVCHYCFTPTNGLPPREDRIHVMFAGDGGGPLHMKHQGTGQVFATADALSEFLLVPVFTGRPR